MSTNWYIHCVDCESNHRFNHENHADEFVMSLIRNRNAIAKFDDVIQDVNTEAKFECSEGRVDTSWFKEHHEHHLVARSEYGDIKEAPDMRSIVGTFVVVSNPASEFYGWEGQIVDAKGQELKVQLLVELKTQAEPKARAFKKSDLDNSCTLCGGSGIIARGSTIGLPPNRVMVNGESHSMMLPFKATQSALEVFAVNVRVCVCVTRNQKKVFG